jgi:hypothetical protein
MYGTEGCHDVSFAHLHHTLHNVYRFANPGRFFPSLQAGRGRWPGPYYQRKISRTYAHRRHDQPCYYRFWRFSSRHSGSLIRSSSATSPLFHMLLRHAMHGVGHQQWAPTFPLTCTSSGTSIRQVLDIWISAFWKGIRTEGFEDAPSGSHLVSTITRRCHLEGILPRAIYFRKYGYFASKGGQTLPR